MSCDSETQAEFELFLDSFFGSLLSFVEDFDLKVFGFLMLLFSMYKLY